VTDEVDFEEVTVNKILYFLTKNSEATAQHAHADSWIYDSLNIYSADDVEETCGGEGTY
jgi:hypothetical protein